MLCQTSAEPHGKFITEGTAFLWCSVFPFAFGPGTLEHGPKVWSHCGPISTRGCWECPSQRFVNCSTRWCVWQSSPARAEFYHRQVKNIDWAKKRSFPLYSSHYFHFIPASVNVHFLKYIGNYWLRVEQQWQKEFCWILWILVRKFSKSTFLLWPESWFILTLTQEAKHFILISVLLLPLNE